MADTSQLGRATRQYVTAYNLARPQIVKGQRFQKRWLLADFNGAIPSAQEIASVTWSTTSPWVTFLENAEVVSPANKQAAVQISLNYSGFSGVKAQITTDTGDVWTAQFDVTVSDQPLYPSDTYLTETGPFSLTAAAT